MATDSFVATPIATDSLVATPWQSLVLVDRAYLIKIFFPADGYHILVSDLSIIWESKTNESDIKGLCETLNPTIDAPMRTVLQHLRTSLTEGHKVKASFTLTKQDDFCELSMDSQLAGFPFKWKFFLAAAAADLVSQHLTQPLLIMVAELRRQNSELVKIIHHKDSEIENYRMQGYKVTRKNLESQKFDEDKFLSDVVSSKGFDEEVKNAGRGSLSATNQQLYSAIMTARTKMEDSSQVAKPGTLGCLPGKSPEKSPGKPQAKITDRESDVAEEVEADRKRALQQKLAADQQKLEEKQKRKRKLKL